MSNRQKERKQKRQERRLRVLASIGKAKSNPSLSQFGDDPLVRGAANDSKNTWMIPVLLIGAIVVHLAFGATVQAFAQLFSGARIIVEENIEMKIIDIPEVKPPELPPPPPEIQEEEKVEEVEVAPEPEPPKKKKPRIKKPAPEPEPEPPKPPPRRIIGADLGSTVEGGSGPSVKVGNALDGVTDTTAVDPSLVKANPGKSTEPVKGPTKNRAAAVIPRKGVVVVKPKRKQRVTPDYPPLLKAQGIEANVVVEVQITAAGTVKSVKVIAPAKEAAFNENAKKAALSEVFSPATRNGTPFAYRLTFSYRYRIND